MVVEIYKPLGPTGREHSSGHDTSTIHPHENRTAEEPVPEQVSRAVERDNQERRQNHALKRNGAMGPQANKFGRA